MARVSFLILIFFTTNAFASPPATLFEGWFEILLGSKKIGYSVERYEFKDNKFYATTYLKTGQEGDNVTESLKAISGPDLKPVSYQYTSKVGDTVKVIDATVKDDTMTLNTFDGKKKTTNTKRFKKGTFLSSMLVYLILSQKNGLKIGNDFKYNAIAEEEGTAYTGSVIVKNQEPVKGKPAIRLLNEFKGEKYFTWITSRGETLLVRQPDRNLDLRFSETQKDATDGFQVNKKDLDLLFGKIPGATAENKTTNPTEKTEPAETPPSKIKMMKKLPQGAPPAPAPDTNQGIEIKGVPPPPPSQ